MPFGKRKSEVQEYRDETLREFMNIVESLKKGGRVTLDYDQTLQFINFLASLDSDPDLTIEELRKIESAVRSIPQELLIIDNRGEISTDNSRVMDAIKNAKINITHIKVRLLMG